MKYIVLSDANGLKLSNSTEGSEAECTEGSDSEGTEGLKGIFMNLFFRVSPKNCIFIAI